MLTKHIAPSPCYCGYCPSLSPRSRFDEETHPHGITFTCRDCGEVIRFGEGATAMSVNEELISHVCKGATR